jgi:hypothetical protein
MTGSKRILFFVFVVLWISGCAPLPVTQPPAPDIDQLNTAIAQTAAAAITQSMQPSSPTSAVSLTPSLTFTPSFTPTSSATATSTLTPTPEIAQISVSVATNCRNGPGKIYGYKSALLVGQVAQVLARDPTGKYWYIPNPESPGEFCWVWGQYATITGNTLALPIYTPPPTPSATFTPLATVSHTPGPGIRIVYTGMDTCSGKWWAEFKLYNTGGLTLRSLDVNVFDSDTHVSNSYLTDGFKNVNGCLASTTKDTVLPEESLVVSAPAFTYDPSGHEIELTVIACPKIGQEGACIKRKIEFIP